MTLQRLVRPGGVLRKSGRLTRRRLLAVCTGLGLGAVACATRQSAMAWSGTLTVYTFGDSILDCGHYNERGATPGALVVRNDDVLFPDFYGRDLASHGLARLVHRARDGGTVASLPNQARDLQVNGPSAAMITVGGNDLLGGLLTDRGSGIDAFASALEAFLQQLPIRPVLLGNVYDPTFGDDQRNFLGVEPSIARANHQRLNAVLAETAPRYGSLVDLHTHFLSGDPSWFSHTIEPSLRGASEVRRVFLPFLLHQ